MLTLKCEAGAAVFLQHQTRDLLERLATYLGPARIARVRLVPGELERARRPSGPPGRGGGEPGRTGQAALRFRRRWNGSIAAAAAQGRRRAD